ncbi:MAG: HAMP domain-containing histidine kinase [Candidatus Omnitrophica bacterium]|nr:HAMP domain-containing histidine kinase [Candidatus Omnitrophota bacterium]
MKRSRSQRQPAFFWQGLLILLPVAGLVVAGIAFLLRDQSLIEQEARQRAAEIARPLADDLSRRMAMSFADFESLGKTWIASRRSGLNSSPGKSHESVGTNTPDEFQSELASWQSSNPGLEAAKAFPVQCDFDASGRLISPLDYPENPVPPDWLRQLTPEQARTWQQARQADLVQVSPDVITNAYQRFLELNPPPEARVNARIDLLLQFTSLRGWSVDAAHEEKPNAEKPTSTVPLLLAAPPKPHNRDEYNSLGNRIQQFLRSTRSLCLMPEPHGFSRPVLSESGLPLANLALAHALHWAQDAESISNPTLTGKSNLVSNLIDLLLDELSYQAHAAPSIFIHRLFTQSERLAKPLSATVKESLQTLRQAWDADERLRQLAHQLETKIPLAQPLVTNIWLNSTQGQWFVLINPSRRFIRISLEGKPVTLTNATTTARFFPKPFVEHAFRVALSNAMPNLPPYFALGVELGGEPILLTGDQPGGLGFKDRPLVLAQSSTSLSQSANPLKSASRSDELGPRSDGPFQTGRARESFPSQPAFTLRVLLANPALLYARHRERTVWIALFLATATAAALLGLFAAWRAFQRQLRLNEMKSNFVSSVSHELRAPIASMRLMAEGLESGRARTEEKRFEYYRFIVQECRRLGGLIENVLDFSRIEQGRKQYEFEPTDLSALVRQTVQLLEPVAHERQVQLKFVLGEPRTSNPNFETIADGRAIQQALINLIDNAVKFSPSGETVTIGLEALIQPQPASQIPNPQSRIRNSKSEILNPAFLWVEDRGPGIPIEDHKRIFERFYRRGHELRRETQGVGIGLSIVKHVVEAHGGSITVRSSPGQGSRFTIKLPLNHGANIDYRG